MTRFVLQRFLTMLVTMAFVSIVTFIVIELPPGDYAERYAFKLSASGIKVTESDIQGLAYSLWIGPAHHRALLDMDHGYRAARQFWAFIPVPETCDPGHWRTHPLYRYPGDGDAGLYVWACDPDWGVFGHPPVFDRRLFVYDFGLYRPGGAQLYAGAAAVVFHRQGHEYECRRFVLAGVPICSLELGARGRYAQASVGAGTGAGSFGHGFPDPHHPGHAAG